MVFVETVDAQGVLLRKQMKILLSCDGDHGTLTGAIDELVGDTYTTVYRDAVRAGWRFLRDGRVLGPCCTRAG